MSRITPANCFSFCPNKRGVYDLYDNILLSRINSDKFYLPVGGTRMKLHSERPCEYKKTSANTALVYHAILESMQLANTQKPIWVLAEKPSNENRLLLYVLKKGLDLRYKVSEGIEKIKINRFGFFFIFTKNYQTLELKREYKTWTIACQSNLLIMPNPWR